MRWQSILAVVLAVAFVAIFTGAVLGHVPWLVVGLEIPQPGIAAPDSARSSARIESQNLFIPLKIEMAIQSVAEKVLELDLRYW